MAKPTDSKGPKADAEPPKAVIPKPVDTSGVTIGPGTGAVDSLGEVSIETPPPPAFVVPLAEGLSDPERELGGTGLQGSEPYGGWVYDEFMPQLRGWQGARVFRDMADNDPMCGAVLFALEILMRSVQWRVEPADQRPESIVAAERVEAALFQDMSHPWGQLIDEATSMLTYGYSPHEIVWKRCQGETDEPNTSSQFSDGLLMPAALPVRSQETLWRWVFDNEGRGNVLGFEQYRVGMPNAVVPIQKALLFRTISRRNNPEGRSVLRTAYKTVQRKNTIEQSEGRLALRSAGVVVVRLPGKFMEPGAGADEKKVYVAFKAIADTLAQDRHGSVVLPSDKDDKGNLLYDVSYLVADARKVGDMSPIIDRMDARIAVSVLADFLLLGTKNVGSFALADTKTSLFVHATGGFNAQIEEQIAGVLVNKIWKLNALDPTTKPKVKAGSVQKVDLEVLGKYLASLTSGGAPIFPSIDGRLEQYLLSQAGLPTAQVQG